MHELIASKAASIVCAILCRDHTTREPATERFAATPTLNTRRDVLRESAMTDINQTLERMRKREADYATEWCGYGHDDDVREANADIRALLAHIESLTALADQRGRDLVALSGLFDRRYCTGYECLAEKPDPYCKDCNEITAIRERNPDLFKGE